MSFKSPLLHYLGGLSGCGVVTRNGETVAEARFDFDGYSSASGGVSVSGEIQMPAEALKRLFGCESFQLLTEQGRRLDLSFSKTTTSPAGDVAHVDVTGDLPGTPAEWRLAQALE
jgi:hypothetical protein